MRSVKAILAILMAVLMTATVVPATASGSRGIHTGVVIDADPTGGYEGDYVVAYNPSTDFDSAVSTGSLSGKIVTDLSANVLPSRGGEEQAEQTDPDLPYIIDVDYEMSRFVPDEPAPEFVQKRASYPVGSTHTFGLYNYPPVSGNQTDFEFKVLYVGAHCTIWTPTNSDYHPLDAINSDYARIAAERFDEKFELMQAAYGDFNDTNGDGKVNLLFYDIGDGWQPGQGYVAGYFWQEDFRYNNLPMIHIDTYPGIAYTNAAGTYIEHFDDCFGTLVHEFQHCINYCETEGMHVWLNEALSGSAEELCFPGSGLSERIPSWVNHKFTSTADIQNPAVEYAYTDTLDLHKGGSITAWDSSALDIYARYAEVMFFTQYLYTNYGSSVFKSIIRATSGETVEDSISAITTATGDSWASIWQGFCTAMVANDPASGYGFNMNAGYEPSDYYGLDSLYRLLSPVVYTSTEAASIYGGGFITIKPVGSVFTPPADASSTLRYVGIRIGEVGLEGLGLTPESSVILLDETANLVVVRDPIEANNYEMTWTSSDNSIATVSGNRFAATVTAVSPGTVTITARATDKQTGSVYTATASVRVRDGYHYTKYVPVNEIVTGKEYMIGASNGGSVYVLMNYNPNAFENGYYGINNYYYNASLTEYAYGIKAVVDGEGAITALDTSAYPDAVAKHAEWLFYDADAGYYQIRSNYNRNYHLRVTNWSNYNGLYPQDGTSYSYMWQWDPANSRLSYKFNSSTTKYITFIPTVNGYSNFFYAPTAASSVQLYMKESGVVLNDEGDTVYYTVTFKDHDGTVLSTQQVEEGHAATAPANPTRTGYTFTGWDVDFSNVTSDLTVTAQYSINSYTLTVNYVDEDGNAVADAYTGTFTYGAAYSVASPAVEGYTAGQATVEGTMGAENVTVTVTYTKDEVGPDILLGDANCDGTVDFSDAAAIAAYVMTGTGLSAQGILNADVNGQGGVTAADITALYNMLFA